MTRNKDYVNFFNFTNKLYPDVKTLCNHEPTDTEEFAKPIEFPSTKMLVTDGVVIEEGGKKLVFGFSYIIEQNETYFNGKITSYFSLHLNLLKDGREACRRALDSLFQKELESKLIQE